MLAAELGKSLLEHNMKLKSSYDSLLKLSTPPITPSSSTNTLLEASHLIVEATEDDAMQFIPSRTTREAMLEVLERKNTELTAKLEQAMLEQENVSRSNLKKTRQLENEISLLKSNLDIASSKITELQEMNSRQKKLEAPAPIDVSNEELVDDLYNEIQKMQQERDAVIQSKQDVESKLTTTLKDLGELKKQFEKFEFSQHDFDRLQEAYESQYSHIQELNHSLEEHRTILQKLKDKGVNVHASPTPSTYDDYLSEEDSNTYRKNTLLQELEIGWMKSNSNPSIKGHHALVASPLSTSPSEDMFHLSNFQEFKKHAVYCAPPSIGFESVLSKATGIDQKLLDETLDFINKIEQEHNKEKFMALYHDFTDNDSFSVAGDEYPTMDLYPSTLALTTVLGQLQLHENDEPKSLTEKVKAHIRGLFNLIWKWCRFTIVLTTALLINAWRGPDALLITY